LRFNGIHNQFAFTILPGQICAYDGMLFRQTRDPRPFRYRAVSRHDGRFPDPDSVLQPGFRKSRQLLWNVEAHFGITGTVMQTPQNLDKIGGDIVDIGFQHGFFAYFDERFLHFLGGLGDSLPRCVRDEIRPSRLVSPGQAWLFHGALDRSNLKQPPQGIIDYQIYTTGFFKGSDVSAFAANDASLHFVRRQRDHRNRGFRNMNDSHA
jgi:hypothetical protein